MHVLFYSIIGERRVETKEVNVKETQYFAQF